MNNGRLEQLGTPIDVYERPANEFVAGFIGVSNLLERDGRRFTIRPEKLALEEIGALVAPGHHAEPGRITEVIYLGAVTRYSIQLDSGDTLIAIRQNLQPLTPEELLEGRDRRVQVDWLEAQTFTINAPPA
jgi:putative spermidine/putrescine transport system ATP-binding protein